MEKIESLKHRLPDFGYPEEISFGDKKNQHRGWTFFLDLISKYRQREKISNVIDDLKNKKKRN